MHLPLQKGKGLLQLALFQMQLPNALLQVVDQVLLLNLALSRQVLRMISQIRTIAIDVLMH